MKTTSIKTKDDCLTMQDAMDFVNDYRTDNTREVKILYNPSAKKYVAQLIDVIE